MAEDPAEYDTAESDTAANDTAEQGPPTEPPGDGPTMTVSTSLHRGTVEAVRSRAGQRGFSRYVEEAVLRKIKRDDLRELLDDFERVNGPADRAAVDARRAFLRGTDVGHASGPAA